MGSVDLPCRLPNGLDGIEITKNMQGQGERYDHCCYRSHSYLFEVPSQIKLLMNTNLFTER